MRRNNEKSKSVREIQQQVCRVLLNQWDPIGVRGWPEAHDEYDSYSSGIVSLLLRGVSESDITRHLHHLETACMGLQGRDEDRLKEVARSLRRLLPQPTPSSDVKPGRA